VLPPTPELRKQRDFIEATSRLASYKIFSSPGIPLTPIEIRLAKDKLELVAQLLASNDDAYRHPDVILDLVAKLGHRGDKLAEVRTLAMIANAALQAADYSSAAELCERVVRVVDSLRDSRSPAAAILDKAAEVAWTKCYQVGRHDDFLDYPRRQKLLGNALILCPDSQIAELLATYRSVEAKSRELSGHPADSASPNPAHTSPLLPSIVTTHHPFSSNTVSLPSPELATQAARSFGRAASSYFPFRRDGPSSPSSSSAGLASPQLDAQASLSNDLRRSDHDRLRDKLSDSFTAGVGWLIGANDNDSTT
jgi:neuroblastoma-amplified sequence